MVKTAIAHAAVVSHDFGKVASDGKGERPKAMFVVENRGEVTLKILNMTSSCGCTVSNISKKQIPTGQRAIVTAEIQNIGVGDHRAMITLQTNDPLHREIPLRLTWHGTARLTFDISELDFGDVCPGLSVTRSFNIKRTNLTDHPACRLKEILCADAAIKVDAGEASTGKGPLGAVHPVQVTLTPSASLGNNEVSLTAHFQDCSMDQLLARIKWSVRHPVEAHPSTLFLGRGKPGAMLSGKVVISASAGRKLKIKSCRVEPPTAGTATLMQNEKTPTIAQISVTITVPAEKPQPGYKLFVECEDPAGESLEVPVSFFLDAE